MLIRFFSFVLMATATSIPSQLFADEDDTAFLRKAKAASQQYSAMAIESKKQSDDQVAQFRDMAHEVASGVVQKLDKSSGPPLPTHKTLVFVSWSLGINVLQDLLAQTQKDKTIQLVFRGILKDEQFASAIKRIRQLYQNDEQAGNLMINPTLFRKYAVGDTVPVVVTTGGKGQQLSRIDGAYNIEWIREKITSKGNQNFGVVGQTMNVIEPDLIDVMKEKLGNVDWDEKKKAAEKRIWKNQKFIYLPPAVEEKVIEVDLSVVATKDIVAPNGEVIVRRGAVINPLDLRSFTQTLVVFNPEIKAELDKVISMKKAGLIKKPVFLMTNMDAEKGWDRYQQLTSLIEDELFMLTNDVRARFGIERTLTLVNASEDGKSILKTEVPAGLQ